MKIVDCLMADDSLKAINTLDRPIDQPNELGPSVLA
jgi:hypothetical protein